MKMLIADDSPVVRSAVGSIVIEAGHEVIEAANGIETIQQVYGELPDLVILDLQMPIMTGYMACRLLKDDRAVAGIPILILTGHDSAEDRYWAEKSGADGYVTKDTVNEELLATIKTVMARTALSALSGEPPSTGEQLDDIDVVARVTTMLDRRLFEMTIINDIVSLATRPMDLRTTLEEALILLRRFVTYDIAGIAVAADKEMAVWSEMALAHEDAASFLAVLEDSSQGPVGIADHGEWTSWFVNDSQFDEFARLPYGWQSMMSVALRVRGSVVGSLALGAANPNVFDVEVAKTIRTIEHPLANVIDAAVRHRQSIEEEARRSLSSLYRDVF